MEYLINPPIGRCKHSVSFHDGVKTHPDGSKFFDLKTFRTEREKKRFVRALESMIKRESIVGPAISSRRFGTGYEHEV